MSIRSTGNSRHDIDQNIVPAQDNCDAQLITTGKSRIAPLAHRLWRKIAAKIS